MPHMSRVRAVFPQRPVRACIVSLLAVCQSCPICTTTTFNVLLLSQCRNAPLQVAVRTLTMAIERGECFGLLGPNGAGETAGRTSCRRQDSARTHMHACVRGHP